VKKILKNSYFYNFLFFVFIFSLLLYFSKFGFDFTDEGYYLNNIQYFKNYRSSLTFFGFFYNVFGFLAKDSIRLMRCFNIILTTLASCGLCFLFFSQKVKRRSLSLNYLLIAFSLSVLSFLSFDRFLITPSYNSLNFQSLFIATSGLILLNKDYRWGVTLLVIGGWMSFLAKPTTAICLGCFAFLYIIFFQKSRLKLLSISLSLFILLVIVTALSVDGSLSAFLLRYKLGLFMVSVLDAGYDFRNLIRFDSVVISKWEVVLCMSILLSSVLSHLLIVNAKNKKRMILLLNVLFLVCASILLVCERNGDFFLKLSKSILPTIVPLSIIFCAFLVSRNSKFSLYSNSKLFWGIYFLFLPCIYAFGTNTNLWVKASQATVFWVLGCFSFLSSQNFIKFLRFFPVLLSLIQLLVLFVIYSWVISPYRQDSFVLDGRVAKEIGPNNSELYLNKKQYDYLKSLETNFIKSGFVKGDFIIDLTGQSPGVIYAIGGVAIGQPWLIGGYKGSHHYLINSLKLYSAREIKSSWILTEPYGPRSISEDVLSDLGLDLKSEYAYVGSVVVEAGLGGNKMDRKQNIYRPIKINNLQN